jgi:hypothetical protein
LKALIHHDPLAPLLRADTKTNRNSQKYTQRVRGYVLPEWQVKKQHLKLGPDFGEKKLPQGKHCETSQLFQRVPDSSWRKLLGR